MRPRRTSGRAGVREEGADPARLGFEIRLVPKVAHPPEPVEKVHRGGSGGPGLGRGTSSSRRARLRFTRNPSRAPVSCWRPGKVEGLCLPREKSSRGRVHGRRRTPGWLPQAGKGVLHARPRRRPRGHDRRFAARIAGPTAGPLDRRLGEVGAARSRSGGGTVRSSACGQLGRIAGRTAGASSAASRPPNPTGLDVGRGGGFCSTRRFGTGGRPVC
jgi:hypothetical protein